ncbi:DNA repair protein RadC [Patescibacteria group bacterium]|nr:DNA repair protein RadC [Patescibacteria group bacterium]MCG2693409.1 DNA repair protein RadC [Candidatus Parcubacteria bacterium]
MSKEKIYNLKTLPEEKRPRGKLIAKGPDILKNYELLAVILGTGYRDENVLELAHRILQDYGSKAITKEKSVWRLMDELGLPEVKACQIIACFELGRRFFMEDTGRMPTIQGPEDVYEYLEDMKKLKKEQFRGLYLNSRNKLIHDEVISVGSLNANIVHPREVFSPALEFASANILIAHNHPSGDPEPSEDDLDITKRLVEAGKIMGIEVIDHIIITKTEFISFKDKKLI